MELQKIRKIISEVLKTDESRIEASSLFVEDLGADSLDLVQIWMKIEEEFNVEVETSLMDEADTVQAAADVITLLTHASPR